jgi:cytochrome c551/c552
MNAWTRLRALLLGGLLVLAGCGGGGGDSSSSGSAVASPFDTGPRAIESPVDEALAKQGEALFKSKTCSTCHGFGVRITGPDLNGVTQRRSAAWMEQQMLNPDAMTKQDPIARQLLGQYAVQMPNLMLKPEEAKALIEFLKWKNKQTAAAK